MTGASCSGSGLSRDPSVQCRRGAASRPGVCDSVSTARSRAVGVRSPRQPCPDSALRSAPPVRVLLLACALASRFSVEARRAQPQPVAQPRPAAAPAGPKLTVPPGFSVAEVYPAATAGSIVNLTFDADGVLVVAKENGPVVRLRDTDGDGVLDAEQVITDAITNCQGLLFAGRDLLATCDGPGKPTIASLYRVPDANGDGVGEAPVLVARSTYSISEHGAHALIFGPDGDVYWMIGNFGGIRSVVLAAVAVRERRRGAVAAGDGRCTRSRQPGACPGRVHLADAACRRPGQHRDRRRHPTSNSWLPASATPTTPRSTSRANSSRSTPTWSGTSTCRGTARCARCT